MLGAPTAAGVADAESAGWWSNCWRTVWSEILASSQLKPVEGFEHKLTVKVPLVATSTVLMMCCWPGF